jgi:capsular exopolysaccharide synthesis family protein
MLIKLFQGRTVKKSLFPIIKVKQDSQEEKGFEKNGRELIFQEQFKALRAKFEYQVDIHKYKVVAVTSAIAEEGKTLTSANLAANLASVGRKKVLLIDTDMRKSDIARMFNAPSKPGLKEFLTGSVSLEKILLSSDSVRGLHIVSGGEKGTAPPDLLAGDTFRSFLQEMRNKFDTVLLDTPPILPVADTMSLRDQVDGFIFIFRIGFTPYVMLRQALEDIEKNKIIGVVLNGVEMQKYKYYQRYYGEYYHKKSD